jgi:hypothetical protein
MQLLIMKFPPVSCNFLPFYAQTSSSAPDSQTASAHVLHSVLETKCQIHIKQQKKL